MDNRANALHELFSRASTPPQHSQPQPQPQPQQHPASHHSSPSQIDSLFHNISTPSDQPQQHGNQAADNYGNSAPVTPVMSLSDEPATSSAASAPNSTAADRQSALLSLLGGPSSSNSVRAGAAGPSLPQQVPTPPGSSQRSGSSPSHNEAQGKILLEQLMAG